MPRKFDFVSPGVQLTEVDQSIVEPALEDDGLLVIGRAKTGPALKPVKVNSLDDFVDVFGKPISGKGTINDDVWRDGNNQGPTYAMYAAQAWLASNTSPVTFVRLLGEQSPNASGTKAGWTLGGASFNQTQSQNTTAYGLFICQSGAAGSALNGTLAAVFYATGSALTLSGTAPNSTGPGGFVGNSGTTSSVGCLIKSLTTSGKPCEFRIDVHTSAVKDTYAPVESFTFHFDPDEKTSYIRNVVNTNPQKIYSQNFPSSQLKNYWLGETYEEAVHRVVSTDKPTAGEQFGVLLALQEGALAANNLLNHEAQATASKSGWIFNRDPNPTALATEFQADKQDKLFRLVALSEGDWFERNYYITIEDLALGTPKNPNSTFSLKIRDLNNNIVEQFSNLNLDPSSANFLGKKVGDMYQQWDTSTERYEMYGEYPNQSNYIYVEFHDDFKSGIDDAYKLPFGFFGPVQPKGFVTMQVIPSENGGTSSVKQVYPIGTTLSASTALSNPYVNMADTAFQGGGAINFITGGLHATTCSFTFPRLKLTEQSTAANKKNYVAKDFFGLRHKFDNKNTRDILSDRSYIDLLRFQGGNIDLHSAGTSTQYSFVFSLDDVRRVSGTTSKFYWASGSHRDGKAETYGSGSQGLLTKNVKQFALPMFGGFNGVDITHVDPFSNNNVLVDQDEESHYAYYSIGKAIDSISDSEVVKYDVVSIPGLTNEALTNKLISAVEERGDALALIDLDDSYKETYENQGVVTTNGTVDNVLSNARSRDYNTSYAATHFPRVRMRDTLSGRGDVFIAPASVAAAGALAFSDANSEGPWFAPAGFNRGGISILGGNDGPRVVGTWKNLPKSERDELYELNINPIARFPAIGEVVIFGQKTLQQTPSALDRINVRRLMVYLKKKIGNVADTLLFDQNVQSTWSRFKARADNILGDVQSRLGISEYKLVLDETTTTPDLIDQNIMYAKIFVKPARAIEFIAIDFIITKSGVEF